ncbi:MAG: hypothetical protein K6E22_12780 [Treponema sp.]|nr:hypothetical protein [Treponema sp.]
MTLSNITGLAEIHREVTEQLEFLLQRKINTNEARRRIEYVKSLLDSAEEIICKEEKGSKKIKGDMTCAELEEAEVKNEDDYK